MVGLSTYKAQTYRDTVVQWIETLSLTWRVLVWYCTQAGRYAGHGWRLGGLGGRPPNKFEVGERPIRSPNILRSTVIGCEAKYELTKKRSQGEIFCSEIEVFGQEKGKNGHQKFILGVKMEFFPKKSHQKSENLVREIFLSSSKLGAKSAPMMQGPGASPSLTIAQYNQWSYIWITDLLVLLCVRDLTIWTQHPVPMMH